MTSPPPPRASLVGIQGLRGLAALLVVVDHALLTLIEKAGADPALAPLAARLGGLGVQVFFLISGLVMVLAGTQAFGPRASLDFMRRRLLRIVPLYWLMSALYIAKLALTGVALSAETVLKSFLFIPFLNPAGELQPLYGLGWTLNHEVFFYALFALGLLGSLGTTVFGTAAVLGAAVWWGTAAFALGPDSSGWTQALHFWTRPITLYFVAGMGIALVLRRSARWAWMAAGLSLQQALLLAALGLALTQMLAGSEPLPAAAELLLCVVTVGVASLGVARRDGGPIARWSARLGDASYSIYLSHPFVVGPLARLAAKLGWSGPSMPWAFAGLCAVVSVLLGTVVYHVVERPLLKRLAARRA